MNEQPLSAISSRYATRVTEFILVGPAADEILQQNARRWFVSFALGRGVGVQTVLPSPGIGDQTLINTSNLPVEYKYRDCPSVVQGAFFGCGMPGTSIVIVECEYLD